MNRRLKRNQAKLTTQLKEKLRGLRLVHLAGCVGVSVLITALCSVLITYLAADHEVRDLLDDDLEQQTELLTHVIATTQMTPAQIKALLEADLDATDQEDQWIIIKNTQDHWQLSNRSAQAPSSLSTSDFFNFQDKADAWRGYQHTQGPWSVQMLRPDDLTDDLQEEIIESITAPALITSAITLLLLFTLIVLAVRPLNQLSKHVKSRSDDDLSPIPIEGYSQEVNALIKNLNQQMNAVETILVRERQFANDIAHELRTPLSTIKLELSLPEPDLQVLKEENQRIIRMVEQLLTLARLEQNHWYTEMSDLDLASLIQSMALTFMDRCEQQSITLTIDSKPCFIRGNATLLEMLITNLINNALEHGQSATKIKVTTDAHVLTISDNGVGMPLTQRQMLEGPVKRMDSQGDGLGIGLTICQRIAFLHQAQLRFDDAQPGLNVTVQF